MDQIGLGKVIFVNGPSFSGKTYFINELLKLLYKLDNNLKISVINFESVYKKNISFYTLKSRFINAIELKRQSYDLVIAESTIINYGDNNFVIRLDPDHDIHNERFAIYKNEYGEFDSMRRIYYPTISLARTNFSNIYSSSCKNNIIIKNSFNNENLEEIKRYVFSS
jgi:hypothetical protein